MRHYRDSFIAHLDSDRTMAIPNLDVAKKSVWFYHAHILSQEAKARDLAGLALDLDSGYRLSEDEARVVFQAAATF
jgi:hypothetical protein